MTTRGYGDRWWEQDKPADLEKTDVASAVTASKTSKDSYTKTITLRLARGKQYEFYFKYEHQDPNTKEVKLSDSSPVWRESFAIPNLTKAVQNLTLTQGFKSYGVKFDLDPTSVQADVVIFESLTSNFATQTKVYDGTSTNVTIQTDGPTAFSPRWIKVRSRDNWEDLNISETTAGPVTPLNSEVNTTIPPSPPTGVQVAAFNETSDPSNYTGYINASWTAPATGAKGYNVGIWESTPGVTLPSREFKVEGTSSKIDGLFVGKSYYVQVKSLSEFGTPSAWVSPALNYPVVIPGNTAIPGAVTVSGVGTPRSIVLSWTVPSSNSNLVTSGGYYIAKIYTNQFGTGSPLETKTCFSNSATFAGLTTGTQYWVTIQPYTGGATPVAGDLSSVYGPLVPIAVEPPDIQANFILANNQFQVGGTSGANDVHLSAYPKTVGGLLTNGRIYIGGPETSGSAAVGLYNASGTPFYADNLGRFSLGDKLTWSGSALNVIGTIDVAGASTFSSYIISGATNSAFIGIGKQVPYRVSSVEQSGANGLTGIVINKSGAAVNSDYIKSDGTFRLGEGGLIYNGTQLNLIGNIQAIGGTFTGNLRVTTGSIISGTGTVAADGSVSGARIVIQQSGLYAHDGVAAGDLPTVSIIAATGSISATKGIIGGWSLDSTGFSSGGAKILNTGNISLGNNIANTLDSIVRLSADDPDYRLWVGSQTAINAPFRVRKDGTVIATQLQITGYATSGDLATTNANLTTTNTNLATTNTNLGTTNTNLATTNSNLATTNSNVTAINNALGNKLSKTGSIIADASNQLTAINTNGITVFTGSSGATSVPTSGARVVMNSSGIAAYDSTSTTNSDGVTFSLSSSTGSGYFKGEIQAGLGNIGGWTINSSQISSGGTILANTGKLTLGVTGDDALTMNAGSNIAMFATGGTDGASYISFYKSGLSGLYWDSRMLQSNSGNFLVQGSNYSGTSYTNLIAYTAAYSGAEARSFNNDVSTTTFTVARQLSSASAVTSESSATGRQRMVSFGRRDNVGSYTGAGIITIDASGTSPQFEANSDIRIKKNFEVYDGAQFIQDIKNMSPYKFHYKDMPDTAEKRLGFIANDFYDNYKDVVGGHPDAVDEDGDVVSMTFSREALIPHMFAAIKYLVNKVEELENR